MSISLVFLVDGGILKYVNSSFWECIYLVLDQGFTLDVHYVVAVSAPIRSGALLRGNPSNRLCVIPAYKSTV